ncbi:MAG: hypothetical protein K0S39_1629 [Paenibacillus sp.]|jgi:hypothetical protein|nr:hypothetical protein [Paenibacillus sp.]
MAIIVVPKDAPTIQAAVIAALPGDLIFVKKGKYNESVNIIGKFDIAIIGDKGAILDGGNSLSYGFRVGQQNVPAGASSNIEIKGFVIQNYLEYGIIEEASLGTLYIENVIQKIGIDGILILPSQGGFRLIWKNRIRKISENGINNQDVNSQATNLIQNVIEDVGNNGINIFASQFGTIIENVICKVGNEGIFLPNGFSLAVLGNKISYARKNGISIRGGASILSKNITKHNSGNGLEVNGEFDGFNFIEENTTSENKKDGIQVNQNNNFIIRNKAKENGDDGIDLNSNNNEIVQNIICDNEEDDIDNDGVNNSFLKNKEC